MKIIKTIPLTYIPLWREQEVIYFTEQDDIKKYSLVLVEYGGKLVPALVSDILGLEGQKIYLKKVYDFKLKKIKKTISANKFLSDKILRILIFLEKKFFCPRSAILKYIIRKALYHQKYKAQENSYHIESGEEKRNSKIYLANKLSLAKMKNLILKIIKEKRNVLIIASQYDSLFYYKKKLAQLEIIELHPQLEDKDYQKNFFEIQVASGKIFMGLSHIIFCPFSQLALIIVIDEASPYYQNKREIPYLNFKIAAQILAQSYKADIIYFNIFLPSFDSFYYYQNSQALSLNGKSIISGDDFNKIKMTHLKSYDDDKLIKEIKKTLVGKCSKILILQNRKGYSVFIQCRDCGYIFFCHHCSSPLKYYKLEKKMICHLCSRVFKPPETCPRCKGYNFELAGTGTEKIISKYRRIFKELKFIKPFQTKKQKEDFIKGINQEKKYIVVGTEATIDLRMKKFDLAIIPNIDIFFNFPDFRASENLLFLIGKLTLLSKKIILGTFGNIKNFSENFSYGKIQKLLGLNLKFRKQFNYPPFANLINIQISYKDKKRAYFEALKLKKELGKIACCQIFGPIPCFVFKRENKYYYEINIKVDNSLMIKLFDFIKQMKKQLKIYVYPHL